MFATAIWFATTFWLEQAKSSAGVTSFLASTSSLKVFSDSTTDTVAFTQVVSTSFSKSIYFNILFKSRLWQQ